MPNTLRVTVEDPTGLRDADLYGSGALIRTQSSATETGAFADITGSDTTKLLVDGQRMYVVNDPLGISSTWYRTRFENAGGTSVSDWSAASQTGEETGALLCSLEDVQQELGGGTTANDDETILEKIRQVSAFIEGYTGRWFAPRPLSGTTTYRLHTRAGRLLRIPKGIRSISTLSVATQDQPATGGTYAAATASSYYIDPPDIERDRDWPGTSVRFTTTAGTTFYNASYGVEIIGAFGWAAVPYDIQGIAIRASVRRFIGKGGGGTAVAIGPAGTEILLPDMSGADRTTLDFYRHIPV